MTDQLEPGQCEILGCPTGQKMAEEIDRLRAESGKFQSLYAEAMEQLREQSAELEKERAAHETIRQAMGDLIAHIDRGFLGKGSPAMLRARLALNGGEGS